MTRCKQFRSVPIASGIVRSGYRSVKNRLLTSVDLPRPDSPTTISVNSKPFFTDLRCTWFGKLAKPTNPGDSTLLNCWKGKIIFKQLYWFTKTGLKINENQEACSSWPDDGRRQFLLTLLRTYRFNRIARHCRRRRKWFPISCLNRTMCSSPQTQILQTVKNSKQRW